MYFNSLSLLCRPQERRTGYEQQFHPGPSQTDHDSLESKRPRLEQVSDSHFQRVSAATVLPLVHPLQEGLRSADIKKVKPFSVTVLKVQLPVLQRANRIFSVR